MLFIALFFVFLLVAPNVSILNERSVHVLENSHIDIDCSIEASPRTVSYWIKEPLGKSFQQSYENPLQNVLQESEKYNISETFNSYYKTSLKMRISNFSESDVGIYTCIASNMMGRANSTIRLYGKCLVIVIFYFFFSSHNFYTHFIFCAEAILLWII
jgi:hypothetical protein